MRPTKSCNFDFHKAIRQPTACCLWQQCTCGGPKGSTQRPTQVHTLTPTTTAPRVPSPGHNSHCQNVKMLTATWTATWTVDGQTPTQVQARSNLGLSIQRPVCLSQPVKYSNKHHTQSRRLTTSLHGTLIGLRLRPSVNSNRGSVRHSSKTVSSTANWWYALPMRQGKGCHCCVASDSKEATLAQTANTREHAATATAAAGHTTSQNH